MPQHTSQEFWAFISEQIDSIVEEGLYNWRYFVIHSNKLPPIDSFTESPAWLDISYPPSGT